VEREEGGKRSSLLAAKGGQTGKLGAKRLKTIRHLEDEKPGQRISGGTGSNQGDSINSNTSTVAKEKKTFFAAQGGGEGREASSNQKLLTAGGREPSDVRRRTRGMAPPLDKKKKKNLAGAHKEKTQKTKNQADNTERAFECQSSLGEGPNHGGQERRTCQLPKGRRRQKTLVITMRKPEAGKGEGLG